MQVAEREIIAPRDEFEIPLPDELLSRLRIDGLRSVSGKPVREFLNRFTRDLGAYLREIVEAVNRNDGAATQHDGALPVASQYWQGKLLWVRGGGYLGEDQLYTCLRNGGGAFVWLPLLFGGDHDVAATVGFQNTWANIGAGWQAASFAMGAHGIVHLEGSVSHPGAPGAGSVIFTLPTGYRPTAAQRFLVDGTIAGASIDVLANGNVSYWAGGIVGLMLNVIKFRARQ